MDEKELLDKVSHNTSLKRLEVLKKMYAELEKKEQEFCDFFCIHCTHGCGKCCERFVPSITELEAAYLAYGLIINKQDDIVLKQLEQIDENTLVTCPLYNFNDPDHHCTVYAFRPLICRLFAASASKDKNGDPIYRNCKFNSLSCDVTSEMLEKNKEHLVIMSDYGEQLNNIESNGGQEEPLNIALIKAINKIRFLMELEEESEGK